MLNEPLYCDTETFSETPIRHGSHAYAEKAEIIVVSWAVGDNPAQVWDATDGSEIPDEFWNELNNPERLTVWHNGGNFDRVILRHVWGFDLPIERVHDSMVQALAHGLPGSLESLGEIMKIAADEQKDKRGKQLINMFCKPRPKDSKVRRFTRETHPKEWAEFLEYGKQDIPAMRAIYKKMPMWNYRGKERALWELDQRINNRGIAIDLKLASAALASVGRIQADLAKGAQEMTDGALVSTMQRDRLLIYILAEHGVDLPDLQASTLERRIGDPNLPRAVKDLLANRMQASTTSTAKYKALINMTSSDGILRGTTQFCGASRTGRWAGRGFQIQNLPSKGMPKARIISAGIEAILAGAVELVYADPLKMVSAALRGTLVPRRGKKLFASDLSNIEGRDAAWLAEEKWKLLAFTALDNGTGADLYRLSYAKAFSIHADEVDGGAPKGPMRQIGKVMELALQYEGGVGAFTTFSLVYNIDLDKMAADAWDAIPDWAKIEAAKAWLWAVKKKKTFELARETYMVCDALKRLWRAAHPEIVSYWGELHDAARNAIAQPGKTFLARKVKLRRDGAWLRVVLPSGRALCYAAPQVDDKGKISYLGVNSYSRKWKRIKTYGGKLFENICQGVARDVMAENMPEMEVQGYDILTTIHDEVVTEALDDGSHTIDDLSSLLATNPPWALDLPLAAGGFEAYRYKKDD